MEGNTAFVRKMLSSWYDSTWTKPLGERGVQCPGLPLSRRALNHYTTKVVGE